MCKQFMPEAGNDRILHLKADFFWKKAVTGEETPFPSAPEQRKVDYETQARLVLFH